MNKDDKARARKALGLLDEAHMILDDLATELREKCDNTPEALQQSERGQKAEEDCGNVEEARDECDSAKDKLGNIEGLSE